MKKLILLTLVFLFSYTPSFAEDFNFTTNNRTQTSFDITVSGSDIKKTNTGFSVLSIKMNGVPGNPVLVPSTDFTCFANVCNFKTVTKKISNLTCGTTYTGTVEVVNSENQLSKPYTFITLACPGSATLGLNQKIIPLTSGGDFLVTLSPNTVSSSTLGLSGSVADRSNPKIPLTRVGLEIKQRSSTTYVDQGNIGNTTQGTNISFSKTYSKLKPNTLYDIRVWVTSGTDKKYTEPFSFQTKEADGTGGQGSNLAIVALNLSGSATEENTTFLYTAQIPGVFEQYLDTSITFGIESESNATWKTISTETTTIKTGPDVVKKQLSSKDSSGWGFTCGGIYKVRGFFVIKEKNNSQPTKFLSPELLITLQECGSSISVVNGTTNETPGNNTYTFLTPLPLGEGLESQDSVVIGTNGEGGILGVLQRIFTIMLIAAVILSVVFMIIGGARYATGDTLSYKMNGRQVITNAVTGLLFALLAWLLLNIVNPDLLRFTLSIRNIGKALTPGSSSGTNSTTGGGGTIAGEGCGPGVSDEECFAKIIADEPRVRGELSTARITIERGDTPCPRFGAAACTTVGLLSETTLSRLVQVNSDCKQANQQCTTIITGATEYWLHGSGGNHKKFIAVDLKLGNTPFDNFIKSKEKVANPFSLCRETYSYKGLRFCNEAGSHWHVDTVISSSSTGSVNTGDPKLFIFPRINIQGYVVPGTGSVYEPAEITAKLNAQAMKDLQSKITSAANKESLDPKLFYALIAQESAGNPQAGSGAGACGVAQILPSTARPLDPSLNGLSDSAVCTELKNNIDLSLRVGAKYLKKGLAEGRENKNALAYYNGGPVAMAASDDCSGRKAYECPWDVPGYYDRSKPNGTPLKPLEKQSDINTGFSETRFYVINILNMVDAQR